MSIRMSMTIDGVKKLQSRMSNRANFLGSSRMGRIISDMGKDLVQEALRLEARLNPGAARDLSPAYKKQKKALVGRVYPILWRTGALMSSLASKVFRPTSAGWRLWVGFTGEHPGGHITNQALYEIQARRGRNVLNPPRGWNDKWMKRLQTEISQLR